MERDSSLLPADACADHALACQQMKPCALDPTHPPPSPPSSAGCESLVITFSRVHKYDIDEELCFGKRGAPGATSTEGVIKVGLMMEERIFDFDRRCGSHARRVPCRVCACVRLLLYPYSQNVIGWLPDASNPLFIIYCVVKSSQAQVNLYSSCAERGLADGLVRVSNFAFVPALRLKARPRVLSSRVPTFPDFAR